jgi:hypothetical protein
MTKCLQYLSTQLGQDILIKLQEAGTICNNPILIKLQEAGTICNNPNTYFWDKMFERYDTQLCTEPIFKQRVRRT